MKAKFTLITQGPKRNISKMNKQTEKPASFVRSLPSIPAKTSKKVQEIFKFFKKSNQHIKKKILTRLILRLQQAFQTPEKFSKLKRLF